MDNPRPEKVAVVTEVRDRLGSAAGVLLTEYRGLTVSEMARLRRSLREAGGDYKVYKNTLVRFAVRDLGLDELEGLLTGPTAIAFVDGDPAAVAKALRDFSRGNPNLVVKGGLLGGNVLDAQRAGALAELPSRDVLLARLAGGLAAPMQQLAGLLQALPRNLAYGLKALVDQGGAAGAPAPAAPESGAPVAEAEAAPTDEAAAPAVPQGGPPADEGGAPAGAEPVEAEVAGADVPAADVAEADVAEAHVAEADVAEADVAEADVVEAEAAAPRVDEVSDAAPAPDAGPEPGADAGSSSPTSDVSPDSETQSEQ